MKFSRRGFLKTAAVALGRLPDTVLEAVKTGMPLLLMPQTDALSEGVKVRVRYSRDHDRRIGARTFTTRLGKANLVDHRTPEKTPVLKQRFLANALRWRTT